MSEVGGASTATAPQTPEDAQFETLAAERFSTIMARHPIFATYLGLHEYDGLLADGSRAAILDEIAETGAFLNRLEAMDDSRLTPYFRIERELLLLATRRQLFDDEVHRVWERRVSATDEVGDGVFLLFARGTRPLAERLPAIASRLEAAPAHIEQQKTRFGETPPVRLWNEMEIEAAASLPHLFSEVVAAGRQQLGEDHPDVGRVERAGTATAEALEGYSAWLREQLGRANDDFALGSARYDELIGLRAFDRLSTDDILEIGEQQLAANQDARRTVAAEIDAGAAEEEVVDRVKSDHPPDFESALATYRQAMDAARQFVVEHDLATLPDGESLAVIATPEYLRKVLPFAAYFPPPKFEAGHDHEGIYIVTPSVDGDERGMREHNYASIYNTGIHEAYPGHHQQLVVANEHPSKVRLLLDAPEFVEGWAMYCEQMMREEGFDTHPTHLLAMHTDAIWRACRIILDIKLHRGEIGVDEATDFLVEKTGFERPNAAAEVKRYTHTPTYQLSYLLGRVLLLRLRDDERRRLGDGFSLRSFHDALLRQGSIPVSFQRRLMAEPS